MVGLLTLTNPNPNLPMDSPFINASSQKTLLYQRLGQVSAVFVFVNDLLL